jgi:hypothetical protein
MMVRFSTGLSLAVLVALSSCAMPPASIKPIAADDRAYAGLSCEELRTERGQVSADLDSISDRQTNRMMGDAVSTMVVGVPVSKVLGEDLSAQIAVNKGKVIAMDKAIQQRGC